MRPVRLAPGADLRRALEALAAEFEHGSAFVVAGIGSLDEAVLRLAGADVSIRIAGPLEILSLCGSLSPDGAHLHMAVADSAGRVMGGHVLPGNRVCTTAELVLTALPGWQLGRAPDAATGYAELLVQASGSSSGLAAQPSR